MLILSINIDPSSPTVTLRPETAFSPTDGTILLSNPPPRLAECADVPCFGGHRYDVWNAGDSSFNLSEMLLEVR